MDADASPARTVGLALVAVGAVHLLAPGPMLRLGRRAYGAVLNAEFRPGEGSERRVRLVAGAMVLAGAHLLYHGGILPSWGDDRP